MPPLLYSFRRCPYAMRARMALSSQGVRVELREVLLRDKPPSMLDLSHKGTVPVLQTDEGQVIDESLDIMCWALASDDSWFSQATQTEQMRLAQDFDATFKPHVDAYKLSSARLRTPAALLSRAGRKVSGRL